MSTRHSKARLVRIFHKQDSGHIDMKRTYSKRHIRRLVHNERLSLERGIVLPQQLNNSNNSDNYDQRNIEIYDGLRNSQPIHEVESTEYTGIDIGNINDVDNTSTSNEQSVLSLQSFNHIEDINDISFVDKNESTISDGENSENNDFNNFYEDQRQHEFVSEIAMWAVEFISTIPLAAITTLLQILRKNTEAPFPKDARTLLQTPRTTIISRMESGQYCHLGLKDAIIKIIEKYLQLGLETRIVNLMFNIDGVPLGKSSEKSMWPILCSDFLIKQVFLIGIYCGDAKPKNSNNLLEQTVNEAIYFINNGITVNNTLFNIRVTGIICDAPAKMELPTSEWRSFDVLRIISTADCYEIAVKKLKSAETSSDVDDVFTDIKTRHSRAKVVLTDNEILSDQGNINKKKKKNIPSLPKVLSTLCEKFVVPPVSDTAKKQNIKKVKKMSVNNKCTTTATSSLQDSNVEQGNKHYLDLSDNEDCEIPQKVTKLLSENSSKDVDNKETNDCPTVMKQSASTLSSRNSLFTKNLNTLLLTRQTNNAQEYDKNLSFKIYKDNNANNVNDGGNMTKPKNVSYREEVSSNSSLGSSTADEKILYLIELLQKVLQKLSHLVVKVDLLDNRVSTIASNEQNTTYKQQNIGEAELESLEDIFPLRTQKDLYSFDTKLANKTYSREVLINYFMSIGGRDFKEMVTNILKEILADSVAVEFSWDGRKKECFRNLHILKEIIKAVRRRWPSQDLIGIKPIISRWLINAKLRISRATFKKSEKELFTEHMDDEEENTSSDES